MEKNFKFFSISVNKLGNDGFDALMKISLSIKSLNVTNSFIYIVFNEITVNRFQLINHNNLSQLK